MPSQHRSIFVLLLLCGLMPFIQAGYGGDCYGTYNFEAQTCSDVASYCLSNSCSRVNGELAYTCFYPVTCYGSYSPATAEPTISSSASTPGSGSSGSGSPVQDACNSMYLGSCDDAQSKFDSVGCACFTCEEKNGKVIASCSSPYACHPETPSQQNDTTEAPEMGSKDYGIVCAVYIATAIVLAGAAKGIAYFYFPAQDKEDPPIKAIVAKRMSTTSRWIYKQTLDSFVQDNGLPTGFVDYFCDKKELFGLIDWRKKTAVVRPWWMRLCAIATTFLVTVSLAFLLGTVVYNNENCVSTRTVSHCCSCQTLCGGSDIGCYGCSCRPSSECNAHSYKCDKGVISSNLSDTTTIDCESASVETSDKAFWMTTILTMVMAKAGSIAIGSAADGSRRQKLLHIATAGTSIIFGTVYSEHLSKVSHLADEEAFKRRLNSILKTLFTGWWYDQVVGFGALVLNFVAYYACWYFMYRPMLDEVKNAGAAAIHPKAGNALDDNIMKTDGVTGGVSKPVSVEEVTLQPPTQPHQSS